MVGHRGAGPFTTDVMYESPGGHRLEWFSRRLRKHASRISRVRPGHDGTLWGPHRATWWIAVLFMVGATCFLVASVPVFLDAVGARADALVIFVGSVPFTVAAALQWLETINADPAPSSPDPGVRPMLLAWEPRRIDWWSSGVSVNLLGCLAFGVSAVAAFVLPSTGSPVDVAVANTATALGALAFLVGSVLLLPEGSRSLPSATTVR